MLSGSVVRCYVGPLSTDYPTEGEWVTKWIIIGFSMALRIHEEKTKRITTVKEVWKTDLNNDIKYG